MTQPSCFLDLWCKAFITVKDRPACDRLHGLRQPIDQMIEVDPECRCHMPMKCGESVSESHSKRRCRLRLLDPFQYQIGGSVIGGFRVMNDLRHADCASGTEQL